MQARLMDAVSGPVGVSHLENTEVWTGSRGPKEPDRIFPR